MWQAMLWCDFNQSCQCVVFAQCLVYIDSAWCLFTALIYVLLIIYLLVPFLCLSIVAEVH